jgi:superfamily II DNA or RNA helicase
VRFLLGVGSGGLFLDTGLGKTAVELEWCIHAAEATNGCALILTPLAVAKQIEREGKRWGYPVRVIREQADAGLGINICNYDRLERLDPQAFGAVALDESSILKSFMGATSRALRAAFSGHRFRLSATATPAPNDHMELGQHSDFCGVMEPPEMLARWFIADQTDMGRYRLKGHGVTPFWDWMASWCRMAAMPSDLGDADERFVLPPMQVHRHRVEAVSTDAALGGLFGDLALSATDMHKAKRRTAESRARQAAELVASEPRESWLLWCDTDYEADAIAAALNEHPYSYAEVRGSHSVERKESAIEGFCNGSIQILVSKPSIMGWGLNFQHCARAIFVGRTFSYESWYQAIRRLWRFGQTRPVECHVLVAEGEDSIGRVIDRKAGDHDGMKREMRAAMLRAMGRTSAVRVPYDPQHDGALPRWMRD